ncbi:MAG: hypothetical protein PQJ60_04800, partial [Spirochaetales bacterium]|nr:hypothetical protein [Spirochaetales bacterium]
MLKKLLPLMALLSMFFMGCSMELGTSTDENESSGDNDTTTSFNWRNTIDDREELAIEADAIGIAHNEMLAELYNELEDAYEEKNIDK